MVDTQSYSKKCSTFFNISHENIAEFIEKSYAKKDQKFPWQGIDSLFHHKSRETKKLGSAIETYPIFIAKVIFTLPASVILTFIKSSYWFICSNTNSHITSINFFAIYF